MREQNVEGELWRHVERRFGDGDVGWVVGWLVEVSSSFKGPGFERRAQAGSALFYLFRKYLYCPRLL